jgi:hypothetical protein
MRQIVRGGESLEAGILSNRSLKNKNAEGGI